MEVRSAVSVPLSAEAAAHEAVVPLHLVPPTDGRSAEHARKAKVVPLVVGSAHAPFAARERVRSDLSLAAAAAAPLGKRSFDLLVSGALLVALLPLIALVALLIKLDSRGPVFYRTERAGHRGQTLRMLKFRKMRHDAGGLALTLNGDSRFTRLGKWLARTKIDEVPQLWNVFKGEMSLVGPRPEDHSFVARRLEDYGEILTARPGIIGLSQVAFAQESQILDADDPVAHYVGSILPQKTGLDRLYVRACSLRMDLRILFWGSVAVLLRRPIAVHRDSGKMNLRRR
jgi:lipopolysaccharide/colanic/teichoic acid biosynthesis glycosyltransferase